MLQTKSILLSTLFCYCLLLSFQSNGQEKVHKIFKPDIRNDTIYRERPDGFTEWIIVKKDLPASVIYETADVEPQFADGRMSFEQYLSENRVYPPLAKEQHIEGKVMMEFIVDQEGKVRFVNIVKSEHPSLSQAAIDIIKHLPLFTPAKIDGKAVAFHMYFPIVFKL
ncbi:hypothetical protein EMGBS15_14970 [Filimonas sp.]|nr:hypothetical protein EMGBS15_14970 [Filimonas sp.]